MNSRSLLALGGAIAVFTWGPTGGQANADVSGAVSEPGVSAEMAERLQSSARLSEVISLASESLGGAYASAVIDNATRTLTLYSTAPVPDGVLVALNALTRSIFRIDVVRVERSLDQLLSVQSLVNALAATPAGQGINASYIDAAENQVHVELAPGAPAELAVQVLALGTPGGVALSSAETFLRAEGGSSFPKVLAARPAESQLDGSIPYKAGKYAKLPDSPEFGRCTSGFVWTSGDEYLGSTAGHCLLNGSGFYLGTKRTTFYGFGFRNQFQQNPVVSADVVFVRGVPANNYTPPYMWETPDRTRRVTAKSSNQPVGTAVRMIGAITIGGSVGLVTYEHLSGRSNDGDFRYVDATCATYNSATGDSGAPVYRRKGRGGVEAYGMHFSSHFRDGDRDAGCYADIDNIERAGSVKLLMDPRRLTGADGCARYSEASGERPCASPSAPQ